MCLRSCLGSILGEENKAPSSLSGPAGHFEHSFGISQRGKKEGMPSCRKEGRGGLSGSTLPANQENLGINYGSW